jgi:hypothetical protein
MVCRASVFSIDLMELLNRIMLKSNFMLGADGRLVPGCEKSAYKK